MARTTTQRSAAVAGRRVLRLTQATDGLAGTFVVVPDGARHPAVLALGGSEGGDQAGLAFVLAQHGILTLALAYFTAPRLPGALTDIPLEAFDRGLAWLRARPEVDPDGSGSWAALGAPRLPCLKAAGVLTSCTA